MAGKTHLERLRELANDVDKKLQAALKSKPATEANYEILMYLTSLHVRILLVDEQIQALSARLECLFPKL